MHIARVWLWFVVVVDFLLMLYMLSTEKKSTKNLWFICSQRAKIPIELQMPFICFVQCFLFVRSFGVHRANEIYSNGMCCRLLFANMWRLHELGIHRVPERKKSDFHCKYVKMVDTAWNEWSKDWCDRIQVKSIAFGRMANHVIEMWRIKWKRYVRVGNEKRRCVKMMRFFSKQMDQAFPPWNKSCYKFVKCFSLCWLFNCSSMCQDAATHVTHSTSRNHGASVFECWTIELPNGWHRTHCRFCRLQSSLFQMKALNCQFDSLLQKVHSRYAFPSDPKMYSAPQ